MVGMPALIMVAFERADARHVELVDEVAGREHRAARTVFVGGRVQELELHFGGREGHAVEFEVAGLLHRAVGHRHVRDDGLADVGLPDAHGARRRRCGTRPASTRPLLIANGPTAAERLPQLPLQSTKALSIETWPNR